ncbi:ABC transporter permease [Kitasatospora sp. A2-31]|uniref:ABC transporter permease n=1 Tax=Kitasatospora sp. A2-31 TaxID=2916414 RepID=UPI001EECDA55|nr:ABC transporter permease [Kitasatospora sp. A2-31]MCG6498293.1 ABC transporter permease [Kitasatospora sp. A2-31]
MGAYIVRRLLAAVLLLFVVTAVTFAIFFLVPRLAGETTDQLAAQYVGRDPSPEALAAVRKNLGFDQPLYEQYWQFVSGIVVGRDFHYGPDASHCAVPCFGYSFKSHLPVWPQISARIPVTLSLAFGAAVLWLGTGVTIGVISALKRGSIFDRFSMAVALAGVSLPIFFTALVSLALFSYRWPVFANLHWVPFTDNPLLWAKNLVLPWVTLSFLYSALYARLTRAGMLEAMSEDYIRTARAKGLTERRVVVRHGLRAGLTPIITIFGLDLGLLLGGAVLTETAFSLPGVGQYAVQAIADNDLPKIMAVTTLAAFFIIVANLVVDVLYVAADPRVRYR